MGGRQGRHKPVQGLGASTQVIARVETEAGTGTGTWCGGIGSDRDKEAGRTTGRGGASEGRYARKQAGVQVSR